MPEGVVQFYLEKKGYGYIRVPETREEFYFQRQHLLSPVSDGVRVSFTIREDRHGLYADEVERKEPTEGDQAEN